MRTQGSKLRVGNTADGQKLYFIVLDFAKDVLLVV
jgi:hypothetical protein